MMQHVMNTYARQSLAFVRGEGAWLWDLEGRRYLDCVSGVAVSGVGHAHPRLVAAVSEQTARAMHVSNLYEIPEQEQLAVRLCALAAMDKAFFATPAVRPMRRQSSSRACSGTRKASSRQPLS